jgi:DNA topoisomerase-1
MQDLKDREMLIRQRATVIYFLDYLALRVGNEKDETKADTVGCCSLRVEHLKLLEQDKIELNFLGKDSMRYHNTVSVHPLVYKNLELFIQDKPENAQIFDKLCPSLLNNFLQSLMPDLTAKVFRTYNASITFQNELSKWDYSDPNEKSDEEKLLFFNRASLQVAILCNHQKTISKDFSSQIEKVNDRIKEKREELETVEVKLRHIKTLSDTEEKSEIVESMNNQIKNKSEMLKKLELIKTQKEESKEVAISTSRINYIDPRISLAWCSKLNLDMKKVFSKTLRLKFTWAIFETQAVPDFVF